MKRTEQWAMDQPGIYHDKHGELAGYVDTHVNNFVDLVKQIQLDAYKQSCSDMADICEGNQDWVPADNEECADAIRSARDAKTEI